MKTENLCRLKFTLGSTAGFTLIEVLIAAGVSCFALLIISMSFVTVNQTVMDNDVRTEVHHITQHMEHALMNPTICTENFKGTPLNGGTVELDMNERPLYNFDHLARQGEKILDNSHHQYVNVDSMQLVPGEELGSNLRAANLHIAFTAKGSRGTQSFHQTVGLTFKTVPNGPVEACATTSVQSDYAARTCHLISGGRNTYDPVTGTCKDRYDYEITKGDKYSAKCNEEAGWIPNPYGACGIEIPAGFNGWDFSFCNYDTNTRVCNDTSRLVNGKLQPGYAPTVPASYSSDSADRDVPVFAEAYRLYYNHVTRSCEAEYIGEVEEYATAYAAATGAANWIDDFKVIINCVTPRRNHTETTTASTDP